MSIFFVFVNLFDYCIVIRTQGDRPCAHFEEKGYREIYRFSSPRIDVSPAPLRFFNILLSVIPNSCLMSQLQIPPERCVDVSTKFPTTFPTASPERRKTSTAAVWGSVAAAKQQQPRNVISAGAIVGICLALVLVICVGAWCLYAYRNPTSKAGLCVINVGVFRFAKLNSDLVLTVLQLLLKYNFKAELILAVTSFLVHLLRNPEDNFKSC